MHLQPSRICRRILSVVFVLGMSCASGSPAGGADDGAEALLLARDRLQRGRPSEARDLLVEARPAASPGDAKAEIDWLIGRCHASEQKWHDAIDAFYRSRSEAADPRGAISHRASLELGRCFKRLGRPDSAARHFQDALITAPGVKDRDLCCMELAELALEEKKPADAQRYVDLLSDKRRHGVDQLEARIQSAMARPSDAAAALPSVAPLPKVPSPPILPRSRWQAKALQLKGDPIAMTRPTRITIHHSADGPEPPVSITDAAARMRSYQAHHQRENGWADIGYHFVIDGAGRIWEGRQLEWQGAHAGTEALNVGNIGVCLMGDFDRVDPTSAQKESLGKLTEWLLDQFSIAANRVAGHCDMLRGVPGRGTACPGRRLEKHLVRLRMELGAKRRKPVSAER